MRKVSKAPPNTGLGRGREWGHLCEGGQQGAGLAGKAGFAVRRREEGGVGLPGLPNLGLTFVLSEEERAEGVPLGMELLVTLYACGRDPVSFLAPYMTHALPGTLPYSLPRAQYQEERRALLGGAPKSKEKQGPDRCLCGGRLTITWPARAHLLRQPLPGRGRPPELGVLREARGWGEGARPAVLHTLPRAHRDSAKLAGFKPRPEGSCPSPRRSLSPWGLSLPVNWQMWRLMGQNSRRLRKRGRRDRHWPLTLTPRCQVVCVCVCMCVCVCLSVSVHVCEGEFAVRMCVCVPGLCPATW